VSFSYLPGIGDDNFGNAQSFSNDYPQWAQTIKRQASIWYTDAFSHLPAILRMRNQFPNSISSAVASGEAPFEHTVYVSGQWLPPGAYPRNNEPYPPAGWTSPANHVWSRVYYLPIMGNAQQALGYARAAVTPGSPTTAVSPVYSPPPMDQARLAQFNELMAAIGRAIGNVAAHETGHQLPILNMDCGEGFDCEAGAVDVYEYGEIGSSESDWTYTDVPGKHLHWSSPSITTIEYYLLGIIK
jgi:hypothetical protein